MLDIIITHYKEPWEICKKQFWMLDMQRRVDWSQIRVTIINDGGHRLPQEELDRLSFPIQQIDIPHGGISRARNAGIEQLDGEWLMFCDCDDCFTNIYALEDVQNVLRGKGVEEKYDMMWADCYQEDEGENRIALTPKFQTFVFCHGKVYRRKFLLEENIRFPEDLRMNEDSCFNAIIVARTQNTRVGHVLASVPVYAWIRRRGSVTSNPEAADLGALCQTRRNRIVTEENRLHRPAEYPLMVTRSGYDVFYMIHGKRISETCKQEILHEFVPWIRERLDVFGKAEDWMLEKIQAISKSELVDEGDEIEDSHETIQAWVRAL